jgi:hypothetical protein
MASCKNITIATVTPYSDCLRWGGVKRGGSRFFAKSLETIPLPFNSRKTIAPLPFNRFETTHGIVIVLRKFK